MTLAQVFETSTPTTLQNYPHQDDHAIQTIDSPWLKPVTKHINVVKRL